MKLEKRGQKSTTGREKKHTTDMQPHVQGSCRLGFFLHQSVVGLLFLLVLVSVFLADKRGRRQETGARIRVLTPAVASLAVLSKAEKNRRRRTVDPRAKATLLRGYLAVAVGQSLPGCAGGLGLLRDAHCSRARGGGGKLGSGPGVKKTILGGEGESASLRVGDGFTRTYNCYPPSGETPGQTASMQS